MRRVHRFGEAEVEHLDVAAGGQLDVRGLQIAMDDPTIVRRLERFRDLACDAERLVGRHRSARDQVRHGRAIDELQDESHAAVAMLDAVNRPDVGMAQRGEQLCLALEPGEAVGGSARRRTP